MYTYVHAANKAVYDKIRHAHRSLFMYVFNGNKHRMQEPVY